MSHENNTLLIERANEVLTDPDITIKQSALLKRLLDINDLEGVHWLLPRVEQGIQEVRETKQSKDTGDDTDNGDWEADYQRDNDNMFDDSADGQFHASMEDK